MGSFRRGGFSARAGLPQSRGGFRVTTGRGTITHAQRAATDAGKLPKAATQGGLGAARR
jgi:hypothetical protein